MKKKAVPGIMLTMLSLSMLTLAFNLRTVVADTEPNDDFNHAELITPGLYEGSFHRDPGPSDEEDFYKITGIMPGQEIEVKWASTVKNMYTWNFWHALYDEDRAELDSGTLSWTATSAKSSYTYYIGVGLGFCIYMSGRTPTLNYSMIVSIIDHYDANSGTDAGDSFDSALTITAGDYEGYLQSYYSEGGDDEEDYYRINQTLSAGQLINVKLTQAPDMDAEIYVYDPNRAQIAYIDSASPGVIVRANATAPQSGTYYIKVAQRSTHARTHVAGDYSLSVEIYTPAKQPPAAVMLNTPTYITYEAVTLDWTKSGEPDFNRYEIYQSTSPGTLGTLIHTITDEATTSCTATALLANTTYYFTVKVVDIGDLHADSNQVEAKTELKTEFEPPPSPFSSPEVIIGVGAGLTGALFIVGLFIKAWKTGKDVLEILRDLKGLFARKKEEKKKKEKD